MRNQVQLITYPDSLGGNLRFLGNLLFSRFADLFGGVHILPPYPSSGDRGFAPQTYFEIDPAFGNWSDIRLGTTWMFHKNFGLGLGWNRFSASVDVDKSNFNGHAKIGYSGLQAYLTGTF